MDRDALLKTILLTAFNALVVCGSVAYSQETLREQAQSILNRHCAECHSQTATEGHLDLSSIESVLRGGEHGPVVAADRPDESSLLSRVRGGQMPPDDQEPLSTEQIEILERWIREDEGLVAADSGIDESRVTPILWLRCAPCHGARRQEAGLDLRTRESILRGGDSGPAAISGEPESSLLIQRVHREEMPPRRLLVSVSVKPMEATELRLLEAWIEAGMPAASQGPDVANGEPDPLVTDDDREFWSFKSPRFVAPPLGDSTTEARSPIDAFLLEKLAARGLTFSSEADRATLIRRLSIDLTGLPPEPWEVERFVADDDPRAFDQLLDRLLASPGYGERWARHWLDVAGYADSEGGQNEDRIREEMWRYRDYVIRSLDSDKSYDRFLMEQIAGDELADWSDPNQITPEVADNLVATGFLRTAPDRTFAEITNFVPDRLELIADEMRILGSAVLGLSLHCSRCHDHKFDPIPQRDYYRLAALLKDAYDEHDWLPPAQRRLTTVSSEERSDYLARKGAWEKSLEELKAKLERTTEEERRAELQKKIESLEQAAPQEPMIRALWSRGDPSPTFVLLRGNYLMPGREVGPGVLSVLSDGQTPLDIAAPWPNATSTGRRLALARWLTQPDHPLTHRVIANRVWALHFGRGIVATLDDFGHAGSEPSHRELLDWLALELVRSEGSLKQLHRKMLSSQAFRQSTLVSQQALRLDPDNALLSRMPLVRPEAEVIRDRMLFVSGRLDRHRFGEPVAVDEHAGGLVTVQASPQGERRSIYVLQRRTKLATILETFDSPQMSPNCTQRDESLVPLQALHLLNNSSVHELAQHFANRIQNEAGDDPREQLKAVYRWAYSTEASEEELANDLQVLAELSEAWGIGKEQAALASYCHAVLNSARFLYVE